MDILDILGYYGPNILILGNIWFLRYRLFHVFLFLVYTCIALFIVIQMKVMIKEPRPYGYHSYHNHEWMALYATYNGVEQYGMPSGHSALVFFSLFYLWWMKPMPWYMIFGLFISGLTVAQRYKYRKHSISQLVVGALLGVGLSYVAYMATTQWFQNTSWFESKLKG